MTTKFAIQIENQFGYNWQEIKKIVEEVENHEFHSFYICDHFFLDKEAVDKPALESWTVLTAAAMITDSIKLGTLVTGNNYRNPALLAKIAASLDMISEGRMEFGIGAGWKEVEYKAYGYEFPSVRDRMDMLEESLQIIKTLWTKDRTTFEGKHYQVIDAVFAPKPVQDMPMILIGGGGEKRTLKMVAEYGDYMNLPFTPMNQIQQKLDALKKHCEAVDRDYDNVGKSIFVPMWVGEDQEEVEEYITKRAKRYDVTVEEYKERIYNPDYPGSWIGTAEEIRDRIEYLNNLGFDYYFIQMPPNKKPDLVGKFARLVKDKYF